MNNYKLDAYSEATNKMNEAVVELQKQGYTINFGSMSGNQGEYAKIDLRNNNGSVIVRLVLDEETDWNTLTDYVVVKEYHYECGTDYERTITVHSFTTLWLNEEHFKGYIAKVAIKKAEA